MNIDLSLGVSKKNKDDLNLLKKKKPEKVDRKLDLQDLDYKIIDLSFKRKHNVIYDEVFTFLYHSPYYYSQILNEIDTIHEKHGYLSPVLIGMISNDIEIDEKAVSNAIHHMKRKGILLEYRYGIMRIRCLTRKNKIFKRMLVRHPTVTLKKPLGYLS